MVPEVGLDKGATVALGVVVECGNAAEAANVGVGGRGTGQGVFRGITRGAAHKLTSCVHRAGQRETADSVLRQ